MMGHKTSRIGKLLLMRNGKSYMSSPLITSNRIVSASHNYWIQPYSANKLDSPLSAIYQIGVTDKFITENIFGSIENIEYSSNSSDTNSTNVSFRLHWAGLKIGEGDELYHSVWDNIEGYCEIDLKQILPNAISYELIRINYDLSKDVDLLSNKENWMFIIRINKKDNCDHDFLDQF
mmetsp:Transcript_16097/g.16230  ORF Transcript_16097/g.16230 Transcript_16097/m.16230 type:complete len:177 (-) Transcript_16097:34-564(-)